MNKKLPTGTVSFLFTDIEGSTKFAQEYPDTWEALRKRHDTILRHAIERQNGYVFRTIGDAFCAAFSTAGEALRAALQSQIDLNAQDRDGPAIKARMGIHTGKAEIQEDGDYLGYLTLTRVQRVMSVAYGGQILLSNTAAELVRSELPSDVSLLDMKEHQLKGLREPEHLWQVVTPRLPQDFPPLQTPGTVPNNLPVQLTSFIGREEEIADLIQELGQHRLVTLTGPGGVGKTRLSLEVASELLNTFQQGVWFVELAHLTDPALVAATIAHSFNINELGGRKSGDMLKDYLRDKKCLLILDNFEQVIEAAALVKELLLVARDLKIMITSRRPLRIAGEYEYMVPLLPLPDGKQPLTAEQLSHLGSIRLFVERAQSAKTDFALTADNAPAIAEICLQLDGLPLAIELAAARVRVLPPKKMLAQLGDRLTFLTGSARDLPPRQKTLRAAIGWSCDLLLPSEKLLFRRLSVFKGGATLEAIESVCEMGNNLDLLTALESLLDNSLLRQIEQEGEPRYEMLETIRDFANEMLVASGEAIPTQERHLIYFHRLARLAEPDLVGPDELQWFLRLTTEYDNLQAAIQWGMEQGLEKAFEMLSDLTLFWSRGGYNDEIIAWLRQALSKPALLELESAPGQSLSLRARALLTLGILSLQQGYADAESLLRESITLLRGRSEKTDLAAALAYVGYLGDLKASQESVDIARTIDNKWIQAYCLAWQSQALRLAGGDLHLARRSAAESAQLSREIGSRWATARSVLSQGQLAVALGEFVQARGYFQECLILFSDGQDKYHANISRSELADLERRLGNHEEALQLYKSAIVIWQELGLQAAIARQFECLAMIAAAQREMQHAARLLGAAQKLRDQTGTPLAPNEQVEYDHTLADLHSQLGTPLFESWMAEGQSMALLAAVAYALRIPDHPAGPVS